MTSASIPLPPLLLLLLLSVVMVDAFFEADEERNPPFKIASNLSIAYQIVMYSVF
jgi:hypothetical protein